MARKFKRGDIVSCAWMAGILYGEVLSISDTFMHLKVIMSTNKEWENEIVSASPDKFILYRPAEKVQNGGNRMAHAFKVGDIVRGISDKFHILGRDMKLGEITFVGKTYFTVKILEHDCLGCRHLIGKSFASEFPDRFELVEAASPISRVLYNPPATVVFWSDDTKTVAKCAPHERFDREKGLAICCAKKLLGEGYADAFKEFREQENRVLSLDEVSALKVGARVFVEYRVGAWCIHVTDGVYEAKRMWDDEKILQETNTTHDFLAPARDVRDGYFGRKYRVWLLPRKPTADELRANPWPKKEDTHG